MIQPKSSFRFLLLLCILLAGSLSLQAQEEERVEILMPFEAARSAGLGTEINESQQISFVNVNLHWAYADANGVLIRYSIDAGKLRTVDGRSVQSVRLTDENGMVFFLGGRGSHAAIETDSDLGFATLKTAKFAFPRTFSRTDLPKTLNLIFQVNADGYPLTAEAYSEATAILAPESTQEPIPPKPEDVFRFEFTVPVYNTIRQQINEVQIQNDVSVTLKALSITPISTEILICFTLPNDNYWELRTPSFNIDGMSPITDLLYPTVLSNGCTGIKLPIYSGLAPKQAYFEIEALVENLSRESEFNWVKLKPVLETYGVSVELDELGRYQGHREQNLGDMSDALVELGYGERIEGPWVFEVDLQ